MRTARGPNARNFLRGACRISGNFAIFFRAIFAQHLRDLDAGLALYLASERTRTQKIAATQFFGSRNHAGRVYPTFVRATRRIFFGNFAILSREFGTKKL